MTSASHDHMPPNRGGFALSIRSFARFAFALIDLSHRFRRAAVMRRILPLLAIIIACTGVLFARHYVFIKTVVSDVAEMHRKNQLFWHKVGEDDLKPGDHVYSKRYLGLYLHHGIYNGNGTIIHFSGTYPADARVKLCDIEEFNGWQAWLIRKALYGLPNHLLWLKIAGTAFSEPSDSPEVVLQRARDLLAESETNLELRFSIYGKNCEGMAYFCKTGLNWKSIQAQNLPERMDLLYIHRFLRKTIFWVAKVLTTLMELLLVFKYEFQ